jgi:hypothetical protein
LELDVLSHRLEAKFPATNKGWVLRATGLRSYMTKDIKPTLLLIFGFCMFLLLVSCINVASLLLARSTVRRAEIRKPQKESDLRNERHLKGAAVWVNRRTAIGAAHSRAYCSGRSPLATLSSPLLLTRHVLFQRALCAGTGHAGLFQRYFET